MFYIGEDIPCKVLTNHTILANVEMMAIEFYQMKRKLTKLGFSWVSINLKVLYLIFKLLIFF